MRKLVLTFGIIAGIINTILMRSFQPLYMQDGQMDMGKGELLGYISMIVALSMIFFGVKSYRDKHQEGIISFGKAFKVGFFITLVASVIYVTGWMIYYNTDETAQQFPEQYLEYMIDELKAEGASEEKIAEERAEFQSQMELYKIHAVMIAATFMEILPVGLIISLFSALILKRKE
ncbi:MAG: DUF4199 domain-containing protein [Saprospiraceae bacterium]